jgi:YbbR domain-containing protein
MNGGTKTMRAWVVIARRCGKCEGFVKRSLRQIIVQNVGWAMGSSLLALILWYAATTAQNPVVESRFPEFVPIRFEIDSSMMVLEQSTNRAEVTVRTLRTIFSNLGEADMTLIADLRGLPEGEHEVAIRAQLKTTGEIIRVQPSRLRVVLARREEKLVAVTVVFTTPPAQGLVATVPDGMPAVRVSGPSSQVAKVEAVQARIGLTNQEISFQRVVTLLAVDKDGVPVDGLTLTPQEMLISVELVSERPSRP